MNSLPPIVSVVEEVAGLDVPVDDPERVHVLQRGQQRAHVAPQLGRVHAAHVLLPRHSPTHFMHFKSTNGLQ